MRVTVPDAPTPCGGQWPAVTTSMIDRVVQRCYKGARRCGTGRAALLRPHSVAFVFALFAPAALAQTASCTSQRDTIDIPGSTDPTTRACWRKIFVQAIQRPNTTVRLGLDVDFDFTDVKSSDLPFHLGHCVTLKSVAQFDTNQTPLSCSVLERALTAEKAGAGRSHDFESAGAPGAP